MGIVFLGCLFGLEIFFLTVCVFAYVFSAHRGQNQTSNPLELQVQAIVRCPLWVLGTQLGFSGMATSSLNH